MDTVDTAAMVDTVVMECMTTTTVVDTAATAAMAVGTVDTEATAVVATVDMEGTVVGASVCCVCVFAFFVFFFGSPQNLYTFFVLLSSNFSQND